MAAKLIDIETTTRADAVTLSAHRGVMGLPVQAGAGIVARIAELEQHASRAAQGAMALQHAPVGESGHRSPTHSDTAVGREIREIRRAQGRTQKELARVVGVTGAQLHRYEMGTTRIAASRLIAIAKALGIRPDQLIAAGAPKEAPMHAVSEVEQTTADDIVEMIQVLASIGDPKHRSALVAVARMMATQSNRER